MTKLAAYPDHKHLDVILGEAVTKAYKNTK